VKKKAKKLEEVTVEQTVKQIEERIRQGCERADKILEEARTTFEDAERVEQSLIWKLQKDITIERKSL